MGRVKLKIQKLDSSPNRLTTYSKRKNGIVKKAEELSVLCDIDIVVLMFSPTGKPVFWKPDNSTMEGIVRRLAALTPQERVKRKLEIFTTLRRAYKNSDHEMIVRNNLGSSHQSVEDFTKLASSLQTQLSEIQQRLSDWTDLDKVDSVDFLEHMVAFTRKLLAQIRKKRENIGKLEISAQGSHYESHDGVHLLPVSLDDDQQTQHCSWVENDGNQPTVSTEEMLLLSKRPKELSAGNSFANYTDYLGMDGISTRQENNIPTEFLRTELLRNELIGLKTETLRNQLTKTQNLKNEMLKREPSKMELCNTEFLSDEVNKNGSLILELTKLDSMRNKLIETTTNVFLKPGSLGNELMKTESLRNQLINTSSMRNEVREPESLRLQLSGEYSYPLYNFETHPNQDFEPIQQMNLQQSIDPHSNRFEPIRQHAKLQQSIDPHSNRFEPIRQHAKLQQGIDPHDNRCEQVQHMILERSVDEFDDEGNFELPLGYNSNHDN